MTRKLLIRVGIMAVSTASLLAPMGARAAEVPCADHNDSRMTGWSDAGIGLTSSIVDENGRPILAAGRYALPDTSTPTQLVVMFHGHGNDSCSWRRHLQAVAAKGAIAVAMDYPGHLLPPDANGVRATYGWFVKEGARDSIQAAKHFMSTYPSITKVFAFGISMGGNASGLAVASADAKRVDGSPLFDYWIDIEGVNNLIEEYLVASAVAPVNAGAQLAVDEIEEENGGSLLEVPDAYVATTNVARAADMAGLKGAIVVNGLDDGLVPTDQTPQMTVALTLAGVPTLNVTVLLRGGAESGTTATGIVGGPLFEGAGLDPYESPLAGHGWEGSETHLVITTGFDKLYDLLDGGSVEAGLTVIAGN